MSSFVSALKSDGNTLSASVSPCFLSPIFTHLKMRDKQDQPEKQRRRNTDATKTI